MWVMNRLMGYFQIEPFCFSKLFFFVVFFWSALCKIDGEKTSRIHNKSLFSIPSVFTATYYCCVLWSVELLLGHFYHMSFLIMCSILRNPFGLSAHAQALPYRTRTLPFIYVHAGILKNISNEMCGLLRCKRSSIYPFAQTLRP